LRQFDELNKTLGQRDRKIKALEDEIIQREQQLSEQSLYIRAMKYNIYDFES
jgi:septal ring factor EnvC (AmiA/AmiB activator)